MYVLRDLDAVLWHCANWDGNHNSVSIHLPLGGAQDATPPQWYALTTLFATLINIYGMAGPAAVFGHREWPKRDPRTGLPARQSECPGPAIYRRLAAWRLATPLALYRVTVPVALIRTGPGTTYPVALAGTAKLKAGHTFWSDAQIEGEVVGATSQWIHRNDGLGYVSAAILERVS